ncbi:hypothetical protein IE81DRAFT_341132 [Ceraceosorus guamensis]|uniref:Uncharacterized protein n=1 Tax=Ceraceosorus guamensis TaxID=1522189 RepID=A0A316VZ70_9BASI|nr:hypothetical protein IE81DRAFT_341132 [Ceraceosorus guamensis]PWN42916.1 hypothetical protein IE81DRAFT_341132 [Ceraceosorus guamensis]
MAIFALNGSSDPGTNAALSSRGSASLEEEMAGILSQSSAPPQQWWQPLDPSNPPSVASQFPTSQDAVSTFRDWSTTAPASNFVPAEIELSTTHSGALYPTVVKSESTQLENSPPASMRKCYDPTCRERPSQQPFEYTTWFANFVAGFAVYQIVQRDTRGYRRFPTDLFKPSGRLFTGHTKKSGVRRFKRCLDFSESPSITSRLRSCG